MTYTLEGTLPRDQAARWAAWEVELTLYAAIYPDALERADVVAWRRLCFGSPFDRVLQAAVLPSASDVPVAETRVRKSASRKRSARRR